MKIGRKEAPQAHHFPAYPKFNPNTIKHIRKAQQILEAKQREEEDILLKVRFLVTCNLTGFFSH
jgi:hypothetical protein